MKKKGLVLLLMAALAASMLTGCGSGSKTATTQSYDAAAAEAGVMDNAAALYDAGYAEEEIEVAEESAEEPAAEAAGAEIVEENPQAGRKLITTMNISAETENFDELMINVEKQVSSMGGYIENSNQYNGSYDIYYGARMGNRSASLTIRIPAEKLDGFIAILEESSNIVSKGRSVEDVTLAYVDLESHKKALLTEQERLLELMEMAETVEDLIALEDKLAGVRYELESMESQLRTYDNKINYSTVYLDITEVQHLTPEAELSTWGRIRTGFAENIYRVGEDIKDFFINLIINIPYIIVWLIVLAVILLIVFIILRVEKKKRAKRDLKRQAMRPLQQVRPEEAGDKQENKPEDKQENKRENKPEDKQENKQEKTKQ